MKKLIVFASLPLLAACATVHQGHRAQVVTGDQLPDLAVSAEELSDPMKETFSMIAVTFENKSDTWVRIESAEPVIDEEVAKKVSLVRGQDLVDWGSAIAARQRMDAHNEQMAQTGLLAVSAAVAGTSAANGNKAGVNAGLAGMAGAQAWAAGSAINASYRLAQDPKAVPADHVMNSFAVPGRMFQRRWILFNKPPGVRISVLPLIVRTVDGRKAVLTVPL